MGLPAICNELGLRQAVDGVPLVNSRDVAKHFEKEHRNVLRDIDAIIHGSNLSNGWFRELQSEHPTVSGRMDRSFDMTRDGFTLLVMGWTGDRAMAFKVRYIEAFNEMEAAMQATMPPLATMIVNGLREALAPLAVRFDGQDRAIETVQRRVDGIAEDMASLKAKLLNGRRLLSETTKREHIEAVRDLGGRCPCCSQHVVVEDNKRASFAEFDHFYQNSQPNPDHTWLICKPCHTDLSAGRIARDQREAEFRAYQAKRRRLPGRQARLF